MKKVILTFLLASAFVLTSFIFKNNTSSDSQSNWYICNNCCKTKKGSSAPWENGCTSGSSSQHNYRFVGNSGDYNYTCRNCSAEVYLTSSQSPSASKCCKSGTHSWYHR